MTDRTRRAAPTGAARRVLSSNVNYWAGQCPGDPRHRLDLGYYQPPEVIDVFRLGANDHVVGACYVFGLSDAGKLADANSDLSGLPGLCLNENVRLHHAVLPGLAPGSGMANATLRACCQEPGPDHRTWRSRLRVAARAWGRGMLRRGGLT